MARHSNLYKEHVKGLLDPSRQLTISEAHLMTGVDKPTLAKWWRELAGDAGSAGTAPPSTPSARLAVTVADADQQVREPEDACYREHGVRRWQLEETCVLLARGGRTDHARGVLLRCLVVR